MAAEVVEAVVGANVQNHRKKPLSARSFNKKVVVGFALTSKMMRDDRLFSYCSGAGDRIEIRTLIYTCTAGGSISWILQIVFSHVVD